MYYLLCIIDDGELLRLLAPICNRCPDSAQLYLVPEIKHGLQPSKGTDHKSAQAESDYYLCELGEAKSAPAEEGNSMWVTPSLTLKGRGRGMGSLTMKDKYQSI